MDRRGVRKIVRVIVNGIAYVLVGVGVGVLSECCWSAEQLVDGLEPDDH